MKAVYENHFELLKILKFRILDIEEFKLELEMDKEEDNVRTGILFIANNIRNS